MNKKLALEVAAYVRAHPEEFDMQIWLCETSACIAGTVVKLCYLTEDLMKLKDSTRLAQRIRTHAIDLLKIKESESNLLFFHISWLREDLAQMYLEGFYENDREKSAEAAAQYIEWFAEKYEELFK